MSVRPASRPWLATGRLVRAIFPGPHWIFPPALLAVAWVGLTWLQDAGRLAAGSTKSALRGAAAHGRALGEPARRVIELRSIDEVVRERMPVPRDEGELLRVLAEGRAVVFDAAEVDVVRIPSRVFSEKEGGLIVSRRQRGASKGIDNDRAF